ncbi:MAG: CpaF family protein, partial [Polyangiales bacterium]
MSTKPPPQANARAIYAQSLWHFFAPIRPLLEDASVSEVMINGPDITYIERDGKLEPSQHTFADADALAAALHNLAQFNGRVLNAERPILEGHLPDGSRVEAVLPPAAPTGPCVAIRRFRESRLSVDDLVRFASLSAEAAAFLHALVHCKQNILVAGGTGSGKTSMLNALSSFIPPAERSVVIEDTAELQLQQPHVVQLLARPADAKGRGRITIRDLFRATL